MENETCGKKKRRKHKEEKMTEEEKEGNKELKGNRSKYGTQILLLLIIMANLRNF